MTEEFARELITKLETAMEAGAGTLLKGATTHVIDNALWIVALGALAAFCFVGALGLRDAYAKVPATADDVPPEIPAAIGFGICLLALLPISNLLAWLVAPEYMLLKELI
jgi:hypothetical protein